MRLVLGDQDLVLGVGEAAEFDTQVPHWFGSTGEGPPRCSASSAGPVSGCTSAPRRHDGRHAPTRTCTGLCAMRVERQDVIVPTSRDQAARPAARRGPSAAPSARRAAWRAARRPAARWSRLRPASGRPRCSAAWLRRQADAAATASPGCRWTSATRRRRRSGPTSCSPSTGRPRAPAPRHSTSCSRARHRSRRRADRAAQRAQRARRTTSPWCSTTTTSPTAPRSAPAMAFLLDHLPPQLHLVISTRADPALPLARLRARGELVEVRAADLRFTGDEAAAYLNDLNGLDLAPSDVAALEARTEGWVAALQLAALSLRGRDDRSRLHRRVRRRRPVRRRLPRRRGPRPPARRRTPLPARHLGPRPADRPPVRRGHRTDGRRQGDAGGPGAAEPVRRPARRPPPLVPLPPPLRRRAPRPPARRATRRGRRLHRRASDWYDQAGDTEAAVRHALAAGDLDRAADLVELAIPALRRERREAVDPPLGRPASRGRRATTGRCSPSGSSRR